MSDRDEREPLWPAPRPDPPEEPSHPGARLDELRDEEEKRDGPDT